MFSAPSLLPAIPDFSPGPPSPFLALARTPPLVRFAAVSANIGEHSNRLARTRARAHTR